MCASSLNVFDFILHMLDSSVTEIVSRIFNVFFLFRLWQWLSYNYIMLSKLFFEDTFCMLNFPVVQLILFHPPIF